VLGRSLDELPPQTRRLLLELDALVAEECERLGLERMDYRFTRRLVRERLGWGNTQLKVHLERLADLEYLVVHPKGQAYHYELVYDGQGEQGQPFMSGLIDVERLKEQAYDGNRSGQNGDRSGTGRGVVGPRSGGGRGARSEGNDREPEDLDANRSALTEKALKGPKEPERSYVLVDPGPAGVAAMSAKGRGR